jgi:hypothetical protein
MALVFSGHLALADPVSVLSKKPQGAPGGALGGLQPARPVRPDAPPGRAYFSARIAYLRGVLGELSLVEELLKGIIGDGSPRDLQGRVQPVAPMGPVPFPAPPDGRGPNRRWQLKDDARTQVWEIMDLLTFPGATIDLPPMHLKFTRFHFLCDQPEARRLRERIWRLGLPFGEGLDENPRISDLRLLLEDYGYVRALIEEIRKRTTQEIEVLTRILPVTEKTTEAKPSPSPSSSP